MKTYLPTKVKVLQEHGRLKKEIATLKKEVKSKKELELAFVESKLLYHALVDLSPESMLLFKNRKMIYANKSAAELFGLKSEAELIGKKLEVFVPKECQKLVRDKLKFAKAERAIEPVLIKGRKANGEEIFMETLAAKVPYSGGEAIQIIIRNVTSQKKAEDELQRLNRAYLALTKINQALVRSENEYDFLENVCKLACSEGGYRMAWVGYVEKDAVKTIRPVVWEGVEDGYLTNVHISYGENEFGTGPAGIAVRTKMTTVFQNINNDIEDEEWKRNVINRGYAAIIALPLINNGEVFGLLGIYSANPDAFDPEEKNLLEQLAADLEFGIISLRTKAERTQAENALRESEARYRALVELSPEGILVHDFTTILYANRAAMQLSPLKNKEEIIGKKIIDLVPPEYHEEIFKREKEALEGKPIDTPLNLAMKFPDGTTRYLEAIGSLITYGGKKAAQIMVRDLTPHRLTEEALRNSREQLSSLAVHLQKIREEERTKVAREIHDELGQYLTGLKMDISFVQDLLNEKSEFREKEIINERMHMTSELLDTTVSAVRRISSELRPAVLDSLGLLAAIEWQSEEFKSRMGIDCESFITVDKINLQQQQTTAVFRILQESLTNVKKHSNATRVTISFTQDDDNYILEIKDNGKGVCTEDFQKENSFGLLGMKERAHLFGGTVDIKGENGRGTTVTVIIPINNQV
ncbi:MAG: PAS domain S-box protein [Ignavibacteriales bacterium]|nr:PAS domain S-box protein [Ignavibacteriales bacterium]